MSELTTDKALSFIADGLCDCMGTLEEHHTNGCPQDKVAVAWLAQVQREAKAEALREAAAEWTQGEWAGATRYHNRVADRLASAQYVGDWLRDRAEQIEDGAGE